MAITAAHNKVLPFQTPRWRHVFVIRVFDLREETNAVIHLLEKPDSGDAAAPVSWGRSSHWKLHLSLTYWALIVLGSPHMPSLHKDDPPFLWTLRAQVSKNTHWLRLRKVLQGQLSWEEYKDAPVPRAAIGGLLEAMLNNADFLCTTPAASTNKLLEPWKNKKAKGVVVDEAAAMNRADLCCVWGNALMPCMLFGDTKQLPPTVMVDGDTDTNGNHRNRFAKYGQVSALEFLQVSGIPVYRLTLQFRMARGMFDMVDQIIYPTVPHEYAASCEISGPAHKAGRDLESYLLERFPSLRPSPAGSLFPVFVHCAGSHVVVNPVSKSKESRDQTRVAVELAVGLVKSKGVDPTKIAFICPYKANVEIMSNMLKQGEASEVLKGIQQPATVDSFQGQENDIIIVVMGTNTASGPGFTTSEKRLNVMLTRQRCGLLLVGDINVTGAMGQEDRGKGKAQGKKFCVVSDTGEVKFMTAKALRDVHETLYKLGRVVTVNVAI